MNDIYRGQIKLIESSNNLELNIPSDKNWFLVIVMTPFILIWLFVEAYVIPNFIFTNIQNIFSSLFWFCGWTFIGVIVIRMWLWHTIGQTKILVENNTLTIKKKNDIFSKEKNFELDKVGNLHIQNRDIERTKFFIRPNYLFTNKTKTIAFLYGQKTIRAVDWLNMTDANFVFTKLKFKVLA